MLAVILLVHLYDIESFLNLFELLVVTTIGFIVHSFLPKPLRIYFFGILSLILLSVLIGLTSMTIVLLIGTAITLISALIPNRLIKYSLLSIIIAGLIYLMAMKPDWIQPHIAALSILGSMFVFRLSLYLYDTNYQRDKAPLIKDWTYFFMLPNMALLLFPVVDYKLFQRKYFDEDALKIYKKGVQWIVLGIFHLMVYRFIYYYLLLPPNEVKDTVSFWHYAITNYTLIIRLSGIFHISVGILCLFGFNLPRVFDNYFLASGFSDLWRRINIYFRDYVIRLFYYPIFFKIRKIGDLNAKVVTILFIFFMTWFLHSLQWFWLRGFFPIRMVDVVFWGVFGVLVAGNAIWETKKRRTRPDTKSWAYAGRMTAQILGMFLFMSVLWSIWSSTTMGDWFAVASQVLNGSANQWIVFFVGLAATWLVGSIVFRQFELRQWGKKIDPDPASEIASFWSLSIVICLLFLQIPFIAQTIESQTGKELDGLLEPKLNLADENLLVEGYYEEILIGNELTSPVGEMVERGEGGRFRFSEGAILVDDIRIVIAKPNFSFEFKDKLYTTNSIGIRDKEYPIEKGSNTIRTAVLGGSYINGSGVADYEIFDEILEDKMNASSSDFHYEFWNFGNPGFDLIQSIYDFEKKDGIQFDFDNLIFFSHGIDLYKNIKTLGAVYASGRPIPYDFMKEIIDKSGIDKSMSQTAIMTAMDPFSEELVVLSLEYLHEICKANNIQSIWAYWPTTSTHPYVKGFPEGLAKIAEDIGFKILSLDGVYNDHPPRTLFVSPIDRHPNELGHRLAAEALYLEFKKRPYLLQTETNNKEN
ncbi:MAG: hypothetical protein EA362_11765 [Saprospirales bacterium]|nr:MAG: hypothetical protein EA362_11765 [Saprospirales bacterium]